MDYMSEYKRWLDCSALSADEHAELAAVADNQEEIESRFFAPLSFGTAGLRGVLGVGLNRMNRFTVGQAAQGLAAPDPGAVLCSPSLRLHRRHQHHGFPQPEGIQRLQGLLGGRRTASSGRGRRGCQRNGKDRYLHRCKNCRLR